MTSTKTTGAWFDYPEDERFFRGILCPRGGSLKRYAFLFDFTDPREKRRIYNRLRRDLMTTLRKERGDACQLRIPDCCDPSRPLTLDHVIPLASNKLNKSLRQLAPRPGGKVPPQSFGSNDARNLAVACAACNARKKHRLEVHLIRRIVRDNLRRLQPQRDVASGG